MRVALCLSYEGTAYHGWQKQTGNPLKTVQGQVENALKCFLQQPVSVTCAGRTDAGVHALGQVIHFDTLSVRSERSLVLGTNTYLPCDIRVVWAKIVDEKFDARFSAQERTYRYIIFNHLTQSAIFHRLSTWIYSPLDVQLMKKAAEKLEGKFDFTSFRSIKCQAKSPIRHVKKIILKREGQWIFLEITANGFLHHMVRNIAGVLLAVGSGKQTIEWVEEVLGARNRNHGGITAPAEGLYFYSVSYPPQFDFSLLPLFPFFLNSGL